MKSDLLPVRNANEMMRNMHCGADKLSREMQTRNTTDVRSSGQARQNVVSFDMMGLQSCFLWPQPKKRLNKMQIIKCNQPYNRACITKEGVWKCFQNLFLLTLKVKNYFCAICTMDYSNIIFDPLFVIKA